MGNFRARVAQDSDKNKKGGSAAFFALTSSHRSLVTSHAFKLSASLPPARARRWLAATQPGLPHW